MAKPRRVGIVEFSDALLESRMKEAMQLVLKELVILDMNRNLKKCSTEYVAFCDAFDETDPDQTLPRYQATIDSFTGAITWNKVE